MSHFDVQVLFNKNLRFFFIDKNFLEPPDVQIVKFFILNFKVLLENLHFWVEITIAALPQLQRPVVFESNGFYGYGSMCLEYSGRWFYRHYITLHL